MYARGRSVERCWYVRLADLRKIAEWMLALGNSEPVYSAPCALTAFVHSRYVICASVCGRAICARSLDGCSCERYRCTVSLARGPCVFAACGRAIYVRSPDGCSLWVIRDRCTVSLACDQHLCMHSVRYVPVCAGVRLVQDHLTGTHVR